MTRPRFTALAVLVIALLFQWTWAVAAGLCRHDGHEATHFGHHSHLASHHAPDGDRAAGHGQAAEAGPASGSGVDCGCCHAWVAAPSLERLAPVDLPPPQIDFAEPLPRYDSAAALRPDRPRWHA